MSIPFYEWSNIEKEMLPHMERYYRGKVTQKEVETIYNKLMLDLRDKYNEAGGMKMLKQFSNELVAAINKYGDEHIDIAIKDSTAYGFYHSKYDSFGVTEFYSLDELGGIEKLEEFEDEFENLCICED